MASLMTAAATTATAVRARSTAAVRTHMMAKLAAAAVHTTKMAMTTVAGMRTMTTAATSYAMVATTAAGMDTSMPVLTKAAAAAVAGTTKMPAAAAAAAALTCAETGVMARAALAQGGMWPVWNGGVTGNDAVDGCGPWAHTKRMLAQVKSDAGGTYRFEAAPGPSMLSLPRPTPIVIAGDAWFRLLDLRGNAAAGGVAAHVDGSLRGGAGVAGGGRVAVVHGGGGVVAAARRGGSSTVELAAGEGGGSCGNGAVVGAAVLAAVVMAVTDEGSVKTMGSKTSRPAAAGTAAAGTAGTTARTEAAAAAGRTDSRSVRARGAHDLDAGRATRASSITAIALQEGTYMLVPVDDISEMDGDTSIHQMLVLVAASKQVPFDEMFRGGVEPSRCRVFRYTSTKGEDGPFVEGSATLASVADERGAVTLRVRLLPEGGGGGGSGGGDAATMWEAFRRVRDVYFEDAELGPRGSVVPMHTGTTPLPEKAEEMGDAFPFVGREEECGALVRAFDEMEKVRRLAHAELRGGAPSSAVAAALAHQVCIPHVIGLAGIGKTRFAQEAASHLMKQQLARTPTPSVVEAATAVVSLVWGPPPAGGAGGDADGDVGRRVALVQDLWSADNAHRNIAIDGHSIDTRLYAADPARYTAAALLASWVECSRRRRAQVRATTSFLAAVYNALADVRDTGKDELVAGALDIIAGSAESGAVGSMSSSGARTAGGGAAKHNAVVIRIAQASECFKMLRHLSLPLLTHATKVYVVLDGVGSLAGGDGPGAGGARFTRIALPLLKIEHMWEICDRILVPVAPAASRKGRAAGAAAVCDVHSLVRSVKMTQALWWLGGVPRLLAHYFSSIAEWYSTWQELTAHFETASVGQVLQAVDNMSYVKGVSQGYLPDEPRVDSRVLRSLLCLAVSERPVTRGTVLAGSIDRKKEKRGGKWIKVGDAVDVTVGDAEQAQLCYLQEGVEGGGGVVRIPPVLIRVIVGRVALLDTSYFVYKRLMGIMSARDSDVLVSVAMLNKLRAAQVCRAASVSLRELGFPLADGVADVAVKVPAAAIPDAEVRDCHTLDSCRDAGEVWIIAPSRSRIADAIGLLRTTDDTPLTVYEQCEQRTTARRALATGKRVARVSAAAVAAQYRKVAVSTRAAAARGHRSLFLYVTDELSPKLTVADDACVVGQAELLPLLGSFLATVRAFALWPNYVDTRTMSAPVVGNTAASPALLALANRMFGACSVPAAAPAAAGGAGALVAHVPVPAAAAGDDVSDDDEVAVAVAERYSLRSRRRCV